MSSNPGQLPDFSYQAMLDVYLSMKSLRAEDVDSLIENTNKIRRLKIHGLNWLPQDQAFSEFRDLSVEIHFKAMAAAYGIPFHGIEDFYRRHCALGTVPKSILNKTTFNEPPENPGKLPIGMLLIELGLISRETLIRGLGIQQLIVSETGVRPFLALIFSQIGLLSAHDIYHALAMQVGIKYNGLEQVDEIVRSLRNRAPVQLKPAS